MEINHYSFGTITINKKIYKSDVIIFPDRVSSSWWRKEGHLLQAADIKEIITAGLPVLIIGTGFYGAMRISEETHSYLKSKGLEVHYFRTQKAVEFYNKISPKKKPVIAALHLTC